MKIVIDMMGGDNGLSSTIPATLQFLKKYDDIELFLIGDKDALTKEFASFTNVQVINSTSVIKMDADPLTALHDKNSSLMVSISTYLENNCDALISAGSTGALLAASTLKLKRIKGISRPGLITSFPTYIKGKKFVCCDLGANTSNTKEDLIQFAIMGSIYYSCLYNDENSKSPRVFLLNNGEEAEKGTQLNKEAYPLLKENKFINFCGNIEGRYPLYGNLDVLVCDGYSGNIFLKTMEGTAKIMSEMIKDVYKKNIFTKVAYLFTKSGITEMKEKMDYKNVGGALLGGVNGVVIKAHGSCDVKCFLSALDNAHRLVVHKIVEQFKLKIGDEI
ncbi:MAG: phosphate acyltransferase PlsX [Candidatus Onthovivens sp.]|nr:phosphate acyltransferase PlsX [Candidatus Onthovivens sp.]